MFGYRQSGKGLSYRERFPPLPAQQDLGRNFFYKLIFIAGELSEWKMDRDTHQKAGCGDAVKKHL